LAEHYGDPNRWRDRAATARTMAEYVFDAETKRHLLLIAARYEEPAMKAQAESQREPD
jgi:hypothetical protein